ncbi:hypothetical protein BDF20DRAFT_838399 [Mycotypha africana]|uniref:uncharacterized protein n=1 Tax=Mycotypha africana TaxID=64632 RepID=UPI002301E0CD|nr:uncharacterized protein BDF20DRAFT_838399 [Mycotypha africana]KAI8969987.1 hypothetical protein BDF20DRAFT_838399 [Mycotypha africana]
MYDVDQFSGYASSPIGNCNMVHTEANLSELKLMFGQTSPTDSWNKRETSLLPIHSFVFDVQCNKLNFGDALMPVNISAFGIISNKQTTSIVRSTDLLRFYNRVVGIFKFRGGTSVTFLTDFRLLEGCLEIYSEMSARIANIEGLFLTTYEQSQPLRNSFLSNIHLYFKFNSSDLRTFAYNEGKICTSLNNKLLTNQTDLEIILIIVLPSKNDLQKLF